MPERTGESRAPREPLDRRATPVRARRAKLALRRIDPWSVFVTSLLLSLCLAVATLVASVVIYTVLDMLGVPSSVNEAVSEVRGGEDLLTRGRFLGFGALIAAVDVVLITVGATIGAMLFNLSATFTGGVELTLAERE